MKGIIHIHRAKKYQLAGSLPLIGVLFVILMLFLPGIGKAQGFPHPWSLHAGYYGNNLWNPGIQVGADRQRVTMDKSRNDHDFTVEKWFTGDLGYYLDPGSHGASFLQVGTTRRKYKDKMFYTQTGFNPLGIYRSILPETYTVTDAGHVEQVNSPGNWYYAPSVSWGVGQYYRKLPGSGWYARLELMALLPYNTYVQFLFNVNLGYRLPLR